MNGQAKEYQDVDSFFNSDNENMTPARTETTFESSHCAGEVQRNMLQNNETGDIEGKADGLFSDLMIPDNDIGISNDPEYPEESNISYAFPKDNERGRKPKGKAISDGNEKMSSEQIEEHFEAASIDKKRFSQRKRFRPVAFWLNERVVYSIKDKNSTFKR